MAIFDGNLLVPDYLEASSASLLQKAFRKKVASGIEYKLINVYYDPNRKKHVAWFYNEISQREVAQEKIDAIKK